MVMEAKCYEQALKVATERVNTTVIESLKRLFPTLSDPEQRKAWVKEFVKLGPAYAELVDLI